MEVFSPPSLSLHQFFTAVWFLVILTCFHVPAMVPILFYHTLKCSSIRCYSTSYFRGWYMITAWNLLHLSLFSPFIYIFKVFFSFKAILQFGTVVLNNFKHRSYVAKPKKVIILVSPSPSQRYQRIEMN